MKLFRLEKARTRLALSGALLSAPLVAVRASATNTESPNGA